MADYDPEKIAKRLGRIEAIFFPDQLDDEGPRSIGDEPSCVEKLAVPSFELREALLELIFYQDDALVAATAVNDLIPLLTSSNKTTAERASDVVFKMSQKPAERAGLAQSQPLLEAITKEIKANRHGGQAKLLASLANIAKCPAGQEGLFKAHTIPELVGMLPKNDLRIVSYALNTLYTLMRHLGRPAKQAVRICGGVERIVELIDREMSEHQKVPFLPMVLDSLHILAFHSMESKGIILSMGGTQKALEILRYSQKAEKTALTALKLLKVLSVEDQNKETIIDHGGIDTLIDYLTHSRSDISMDALWTLRNISDQINQVESADPSKLMEVCIKKLSSHDLNHVISAAGILSNLTCNDYINKTTFVELGGVQAMTRVVQRASSKDGFRDDVVEPGITALRHVTRDRGDESGELGSWAEKARKQFQNLVILFELIMMKISSHETLIPTVTQLLTGPQSASWPTVKATIGFIRNLCHDKRNRELFMNQDLISKLVQLLTNAEQEIVTGSDIVSEGIDMIDIAEGCCGALQLMARDSDPRKRIRGDNILPGVIVLLQLDHSNLQRSVAGFLCEMSADRGTREILYKLNLEEGSSLKEDLLTLLQAESEATVTYAAITLVRLTSYIKDKDSQSIEIDKVREQMVHIIANRVGDDQLDNYAPDELSRFGYDSTIKRPTGTMTTDGTMRSMYSTTSGSVFRQSNAQSPAPSLSQVSVNQMSNANYSVFEQEQMNSRDQPDFGFV